MSAGLGSAVDGVGDVNRDGFPDVIVGASEADPDGRYGAGSAYVYSGKDGTLLWQFHGGTAYDGLGASVAGAGDVNRDGVPDVIVGAPMSFLGRSTTGYARVFSGKDGTILWQFDGAVEDDHLGTAVAGANDVNGDGFDDLIVGAPGSSINPNRPGSVYIYSGKDGTVLRHFVGERAGDRLGCAVGGAGDIDLDGIPDVIVGARGAASGGFARVYSGADGAVLWQFNGGDVGRHSLGASAAGAGDVNRDGVPDVIVGAPGAGAGGFAVVYSGADGSRLWQLDGENVGGYFFGSAVSGAGDVNRDGFDDLIVGASQSNPAAVFRAGSAFVFSGKSGSLIWQLNGTDHDQYVGAGVAAAGDVNQDGFPDVIVGAPGTDSADHADTGSASIHVFRAARTHLSGILGAHLTLEGHTTGDGFGFSVHGVGDVNLDGSDDLIVGAPGSAGRGCARVYSGADGREIWEFPGPYEGAEMGSSVAGAGDVDRDGVVDLIVGARRGGPGRTGSAYVYSGADGTLLREFRGALAGEELGSSVAAAGDINRDGFADVLIGAPHAGPNRAGSAYVFSGADGTRLYQLNGTSAGEEFGCAVALAGDVNLDGVSDVIIGSRYKGRDRAGAAYVYSGRDGSLLWLFSGSGAQHLGGSVAAAGDVNRDGFPDLIVGATGTAPDGSADVYSGKDGTRLWQFAGDSSDVLSLGGSVAGAGDVNRDGFDDVIVGASRADGGSACIYSGKDGTRLWRFDPEAKDDLLGWSVAAAGDVNRDGFPDVIVSTYRGNGEQSTRQGTADVYVYKPAFRWYGTGVPGSGNITPRISTGGQLPEPGSLTFRIQLTEAVGDALCGIVGSFSPAEQPFAGGTLYGDFVTPGAFAVWGFTTTGRTGVPGVGTAILPFPLPRDPDLVGLTTYWQAFVVDTGSPLDIGISHTDGLAVTVVF